MISDVTRYLLMARFLPGIGKIHLKKVVEFIRLNPCEGVIELADFCMKHFGVTSSNLDEALKKADEQIKIAASCGHRIISILDGFYPDCLKYSNNPPVILYCNGNIDALKINSVAIIGTREPTSYGVTIAESVTEFMVNDGWGVVSGLAKGLDTIAHRRCLDVGGVTIAVLAQGLDKIYPAENRYLAKSIVDNGGLLVTEYDYKSTTYKSNFVDRDYIQAALSKAVFLIQSGIKGGSLHASRAILQLNRYLVVAGQSKIDSFRREEKIMANMVLFFGSESEKQSLLKVDEYSLKRILLMKDKNQLRGVSDIVRELQFHSDTESSGLNIPLF